MFPSCIKFKRSKIFVKFDNPTRIYLPGQLVSGVVVMDLVKKLKPKLCVTVSIYGRSRTHKNTTNPTATESVNLKQQCCTELLYIEEKNTVWFTTPCNTTVNAGRNQFPIRFHLPKNCPVSFEGFYGYVRYEICVQVDDRFLKMEKNLITVVHKDTVEYPIEYFRNIEHRTSNVERNKRITITCFRLNKKVFYPGEDIQFEADIENNSNRLLCKATIKILQEAQYKIGDNSDIISENFQERLTNMKFNTEMECLPVAESKNCIHILPDSKEVIQCNITVPAVVQTMQSHLINVNYYIWLEIHSGKLRKESESYRYPIIISRKHDAGADIIEQHDNPFINHLPILRKQKSLTNRSALEKTRKLNESHRYMKN